MVMASTTRKQYEMNGMDYLVDTNILIYTLDGTIDPSRFEPGSWFYFFISEIELSGKPGLTGEQLTIIKDALSICQKAHYHNQMVDIASHLRRTYKIKLPDALLAACAIFYDIPLLTADKGFATIKELNLVLLEV
jgi:predicted nucleic acid-binding protein